MALTVLIPTIERPTLADAIRSVRNQTLPCHYIVQFDPERTGCGPTLNRALRHVRTDWVAGVADDDRLAPTFNQRLHEQDQEADLVIFQINRKLDGAVVPTTTDPAELRFGEVGGAYAVKTEFVRRVGGWIDKPSTPELAEDWELIRSVRDAGGRIVIVPEVLYYVGGQCHVGGGCGS